jgi:hypothetical protein
MTMMVVDERYAKLRLAPGTPGTPGTSSLIPNTGIFS